MEQYTAQLNFGQVEIFNKVVQEGINIFFTGCAGTGKSFLLKKIIAALQDKFKGKGFVAVTASTGRAAFNIEGTTLHSFAGIGLGKESEVQLSNRIKYNKKLINRWRTTKVLIIDEVSMITGELFDKLEYIARFVLNNNRPFGGIQLVLTGDALQLPPVDNGLEKISRIFEANSWLQCIKEYRSLRTVVRQVDEDFIKMLVCIRIGYIGDEIKDMLAKACKPKIYNLESAPVYLYSTKSRTEEHNIKKLNELTGTELTYNAADKYGHGIKSTTNILDSCPAPLELHLKVGAQVMLIKNLNTELVNGSVGVVTGFIDLSNRAESSKFPHGYLKDTPIVRFELTSGKIYTKYIGKEVWELQQADGTLMASRCQVPLILSWAVTIHKSQGQTIERVKADLTGVFESGQVYTALSRTPTIDGLEVVGFDSTKIKVDQKSLSFYLENELI